VNYFIAATEEADAAVAEEVSEFCFDLFFFCGTVADDGGGFFFCDAVAEEADTAVAEEANTAVAKEADTAVAEEADMAVAEEADTGVAYVGACFFLDGFFFCAAVAEVADAVDNEADAAVTDDAIWFFFGAFVFAGFFFGGFFAVPPCCF
jgi:hypothetical protein